MSDVSRLDEENNIYVKIALDGPPNAIEVGGHCLNKKGDIITLEGFGAAPVKMRVTSITSQPNGKRLMNLERV